MGTPDTIHIHPDVMDHLDPKCPVCGNRFKDSWQSKSLSGGDMSSYYLKYGQDPHPGGIAPAVAQFSIRLYALDGPDDRYWQEFTQQEIDEWNARVEDSWLKFTARKPGDGRHTKEGYLPENRRARDMGELPHQWFNIHTSCDHKDSIGWVDVNLKFTDGSVTEHTTTYEQIQKYKAPQQVEEVPEVVREPEAEEQD